MNEDRPNIDVIIRHNFGDVRVTLEEWIKNGPGPRLFIRPVKAIDRDSGEELPLDSIPFQYRNDLESIQAIIKGKIIDPWHRDLADLKTLFDRKGK